MLKKIFHDGLNISKITRVCMENHSSVTGWQELFFILLNFGGRCNRYFWDIRLKISNVPNFNMLSQLVLTKCFKANYFRVHRKLITWSTNANLWNALKGIKVIAPRNSKKSSGLVYNALSSTQHAMRTGDDKANFSTVACITGALWAKRGKRGICAKCETRDEGRRKNKAPVAGPLFWLFCPRLRLRLQIDWRRSCQKDQWKVENTIHKPTAE